MLERRSYVEHTPTTTLSRRDVLKAAGGGAFSLALQSLLSDAEAADIQRPPRLEDGLVEAGSERYPKSFDEWKRARGIHKVPGTIETMLMVADERLRYRTSGGTQKSFGHEARRHMDSLLHECHPLPPELMSWLDTFDSKPQWDDRKTLAARGFQGFVERRGLETQMTHPALYSTVGGYTDSVNTHFGTNIRIDHKSLPGMHNTTLGMREAPVTSSLTRIANSTESIVGFNRNDWHEWTFQRRMENEKMIENTDGFLISQQDQAFETGGGFVQLSTVLDPQLGTIVMAHSARKNPDVPYPVFLQGPWDSLYMYDCEEDVDLLPAPPCPEGEEVLPSMKRPIGASKNDPMQRKNPAYNTIEAEGYVAIHPQVARLNIGKGAHTLGYQNFLFTRTKNFRGHPRIDCRIVLFPDSYVQGAQNGWCDIAIPPHYLSSIGANRLQFFRGKEPVDHQIQYQQDDRATRRIQHITIKCEKDPDTVEVMAYSQVTPAQLTIPFQPPR